jgi:hypothetical protein
MPLRSRFRLAAMCAIGKGARSPISSHVQGHSLFVQATQRSAIPAQTRRI